jgi:hypothetical protein
MNYLIPGQQGNLAAFTANNTYDLGSYDKPIDGKALISVDYSKLIPAAAIAGYSFKVSPGGMPGLSITASKLASPATSLTFMISGGIANTQYTVTIVAKLVDGETRSDALDVNVFDPDGDDACYAPPTTLPAASPGTSKDGYTFTNSDPRFFLSSTPPAGANLMDQWFDPSTNTLYSYVTNGVTSYWRILVPPAPAPVPPGGALLVTKIQPLVFNGMNTIFNLTAVGGGGVSINSVNDLLVSLDGVWQEPTVQYTTTSNTITFAQAPSADSIVFMLWLNGAY